MPGTRSLILSKSMAPKLLAYRANRSPIHHRLQQEIRRRVESGQWALGSVIPPERKIAEKYGLSLGTVRTAILNLVAEGLLYRIQGKGTMVAGTRIMRENLRYYRFLAEFGRKEAVPQLELLDLVGIDGQPEINHRLKLNLNGKLYRLRRIVRISHKPCIYCISYLPQKLFEGLKGLPRSSFEKTPLYLSIEERFGLPTVRNSELISAVPADIQTAELLEINPGEPILAVEMLSFTYKYPYEYRMSYCLTRERKLLRIY